MNPERSRKFHNRSRDGCTTCRKRRVRCDGARPHCWNCLRLGRTCEFQSNLLPLREKRAKSVPGEQKPFSIDSKEMKMPSPRKKEMAIIGYSMFHVEAFAIPMPLKSRELLHYFREMSDMELISVHNKNQSLSSIVQHPDILRNTLLVAAMHYAWRVGGFKGFESTFLFHKIDTMQLLNSSLKSSEGIGHAALARYIATLCQTECSLGNITAAETHRDGLVGLMDLHMPRGHELEGPMAHDEQVAYRNLIIICNSIHGLKSRIYSSKTLCSLIEASGGIAPHPKMVSLLHQWDGQGIGRLDMIMKSILLLPFFQTVSRETILKDVDAKPIIDCLRLLTEAASRERSEEKETTDPGSVWIDGTASRLLYTLMSSQVISASDLGHDLGCLVECDHQCNHNDQIFETSWCGIATASELYLKSILNIWNAGDPIDTRVFKRMILVMVQDLKQTCHQVMQPTASGLWIWKALIGASSLAQHACYSNDKEEMEALEATFDGLILLWSRANSVAEWTDVHIVLSVITWPVDLRRTLPERVWCRATKH